MTAAELPKAAGFEPGPASRLGVVDRSTELPWQLDQNGADQGLLVLMTRSLGGAAARAASHWREPEFHENARDLQRPTRKLQSPSRAYFP